MAWRFKYPSANREWAWQWVFPATRHYRDTATVERRRHHLHESVVQRGFHRPVLDAPAGRSGVRRRSRPTSHIELCRPAYPGGISARLRISAMWPVLDCGLAGRRRVGPGVPFIVRRLRGMSQSVRATSPATDLWVWLFPLAYGLHIAEEYAFHFSAYVANLSVRYISNPPFLVINAVFWLLMAA